MVEKLKLKVIYDDFISSVSLTEEQIKILNMYLKKDSTVKIAMEIGVSPRTITYEIKKIKKLYEDYVFMQTWKALLLL
jgi:transcriptional antiterminator